MSEPTPTANNVIALVPRRSATASETRHSPAAFLANELWNRIGATDLTSDIVQVAIDGIVREIVQQARAEGEQKASDRLAVEIGRLRAEIARRDTQARAYRAPLG